MKQEIGGLHDLNVRVKKLPFEKGKSHQIAQDCGDDKNLGAGK